MSRAVGPWRYPALPAYLIPFALLAAVLSVVVAVTWGVEAAHRREVRRAVLVDMARQPPLPPRPGLPLDLTRAREAPPDEANLLTLACASVGMHAHRWERSGDAACADADGVLHEVP